MTPEQGKIILEEGWFYGLETIVTRWEVSPDKGAAAKAGMFKLILAKIEEAKKEVAKLEAAVTRMEAAARAGSVPKIQEGMNFRSADIMRLRAEMKALHGWTISLLESDISILAAVESPKAAGESVRGIQRSFAELWALRIEDGAKMMKNFPEVFDRVLIR